MKNKRLLSCLIALALLLATSFNETSAQLAKWDDQSDELPGMVGDGEILLIAGGGVLLIGGLVTYLIIKKKQDKKLESSVTDMFKTGSLGSVSINNADENNWSSMLSNISNATEQASVVVFTRCNNIPGQDYNVRQAMSVGVRVTF